MPEHKDLKRHAVSGAKWIGLSTVVTAAFQFLQIAILTRFLSPVDFGLMAMAMVVVGVVQSFTDMGISNAVIQRKDTTQDRLSSLFWLEVGVGVALFLLTVAMTPLVVQFYNEPDLALVMLWISGIFLVTAPGQLFCTLIQKDLKFRKMATIEISSSLISLIATVAAAYFGLGVMALVLGQIIYFGSRSLQFIVSGLPAWRPRLHFRPSDISGYIGFGMYQMGERIVTYLSINVINLIIGRYLGAGALGQYSVAYQLIVYPITRLNNVIMQVSFPIFAKFQDVNAMLRSGYLHLARVISFALFPIVAVMFVAAPVFVPMFLGPGWSEVTPIFQILCAVGLFKVLGSTTVPTYLAKGRADLGFTWNLGVAIVNGVVFYLLAGYGIIMLTLTFAALSMFQFVAMQTITGHIIGLKWRSYLGAMARNAAKSVAVGALIYALSVMGSIVDLADLPLLSAMVLTGTVTYAAVAVVFNREYLMELWELIMPVQKRGERQVSEPVNKKGNVRGNLVGRIIYVAAATDDHHPES